MVLRRFAATARSARPPPFDEAVLPASRSREDDFRTGVLSDIARAEACQLVRQMLADPAEPDPTTAPILCIPVTHKGDEIAGKMLTQVLAEARISASVLSSKLLAAESVEPNVTNE